MDDTYETKDQQEIAWLLYHDPTLRPDELYERRIISDENKDRTEIWFTFPDRYKQMELLELYKHSREREFAMQIKKLSKFIREHK